MDELKTLKPWERACVYCGTALFLISALLLAIGLEVLSEFPSARSLGVPWLYVGVAAVVIVALAAALWHWRQWIPVMLFFKPWSVPLMGVGWCLVVCGLTLALSPNSGPQAAVPTDAVTKLRPSSLVVFSGFGLYGIAFMVNADRFAAKRYKDLCTSKRACPKCRNVAIPMEGRCPTCGDDAPRRESLKLGAYVFGGIPASFTIIILLESARWNEMASFAGGFLVWGCAGVVFYKAGRANEVRLSR
jgi:hypothetical protein